MRLIAAVAGTLLKWVGQIAAVVASLFVVYLLIQAAVPAIREAAADQARLRQVVEDQNALRAELRSLQKQADEGRDRAVGTLTTGVAAEIERTRSAVRDVRENVRRLSSREAEICGIGRKIIDFLTPADVCRKAQQAVERANRTLDTLERNQERARAEYAVLTDPSLTPEQKLARLGNDGGQSSTDRRISTTRSELSQKEAERSSLEAARSSGAGWLVYQWSRSWKWLLAIALLAFFMPALVRTISYFVFMPIVHRRQRRITLSTDAEAAERAVIRWSDAQRTLQVQLRTGEALSARSEYVRPVQGNAQSKILYDWTAPFISFAAGLKDLTRVTGDGGPIVATLSSPSDPDSYLMRIDLANHPGVVMRPANLVGIVGNPELKTQWRWGLVALATFQLRYILFTGDGSLIVEGVGDVAAQTPQDRSIRIDQNLMMGFDSRLSRGIRRTEAFLPYLRGRKPLVDDEFAGDGKFFWQKSSPEPPKNPLARAFDTFLSGVGKLLGF